MIDILHEATVDFSHYIKLISYKCSILLRFLCVCVRVCVCDGSGMSVGQDYTSDV